MRDLSIGIISLAHAPVHVTDFPVVNVHVNELSSARIWQHKLCATLSANVNINYRLPIKVYYHICTLRHIRIEIIHGSQNVFWVLTWVGGYLKYYYRRGIQFTNIRQPMLKLKTHSGFHDLCSFADLFIMVMMRTSYNWKDDDIYYVLYWHT
jgi:hypothetical protein